MSSSLTTKRRKVSSGSYTLNTMRSEPFHTGFRPLSPAGGRNVQRFDLWSLKSLLNLKSPEPQAEKHKSSRRIAGKAKGARALIILRFFIIIIFCDGRPLLGLLPCERWDRLQPPTSHNISTVRSKAPQRRGKSQCWYRYTTNTTLLKFYHRSSFKSLIPAESAETTNKSKIFNRCIKREKLDEIEENRKVAGESPYDRQWSCTSRLCARTTRSPQMDWRCCGLASEGVWHQSPARDKHNCSYSLHTIPKCIFVHKLTLNVTHNNDRGTESVCACVRVAAHLDHNFVFDFLLVLMRVVAIHTHELRLQHVARLSVQTEEGVVQLHVFIWVDTLALQEPE